MKLHIFPILSSILLLASCEAIPVTEFTDRPVVSCYLISGESPTLTVKKVIPFQSDATFSDEDVDKLSITISDLTSGIKYLLENKGEGKYSNPDLVVETGHGYSLSFVYDNVPVSAETVVPEAPQNVSFSSTSIEVMGGGFQPKSDFEGSPQNGISITWDNDDEDYYIVEGRTYSNNPIMDYDDDDDLPSRSFKQSYTQGEDATLSSSDFNYYGTYHIYVMHICQEYAVFSQGGSTSSTTLVDVQGNIDGAYGIFTGIGRVTKDISVTKGSMMM